MPEKLFPEVIRNLKLFDGVAPSDVTSLLKESRIAWYKRGDYLFRQGDPVRHFYIVCNGTFQLYKQTPDGKQITTDVVITGKTLCKTEIFNSRANRHQQCAVAVSDATVLEFPSSWLREAAKNPTIALNILSAVSQYAHMIEVETEHKSTMTAPQQVACFLHRLYLLRGFDAAGFELPYSKRLIASRLGMEPETFSRALAKIKNYGIEVTDNHVRIADVEKMEAYVCGHCSMAGDCIRHKEDA